MSKSERSTLSQAKRAAKARGHRKVVKVRRHTRVIWRLDPKTYAARLRAVEVAEENIARLLAHIERHGRVHGDKDRLRRLAELIEDNMGNE